MEVATQTDFGSRGDFATEVRACRGCRRLQDYNRQLLDQAAAIRRLVAELIFAIRLVNRHEQVEDAIKLFFDKCDVAKDQLTKRYSGADEERPSKANKEKEVEKRLNEVEPTKEELFEGESTELEDDASDYSCDGNDVQDDDTEISESADEEMEETSEEPNSTVAFDHQYGKSPLKGASQEVDVEMDEPDIEAIPITTTTLTRITSTPSPQDSDLKSEPASTPHKDDNKKPIRTTLVLPKSVIPRLFPNLKSTGSAFKAVKMAMPVGRKDGESEESESGKPKTKTVYLLKLSGNSEMKKPIQKKVEANKNQIFLCYWPDCHEQFTSKSLLLTHAIEKHKSDVKLDLKMKKSKEAKKQTRFACPMDKCRNHYKSRWALNRHLGKEHCDAEQSKNRHKCKQADCQFKSVTDSGDNSNLKENDESGQEMECHWPECESKFTCRLMMLDHLKNHASEQTIESSNKSDPNKEQTRFACPLNECRRHYGTRMALNKHLGKHKKGLIEIDWNTSNGKPFARLECEVAGCKFKGRYPSELKCHYRRRHLNQRDVKCTWPGCDMNFYSQAELKSHLLRHTKEKPFKCDWPDCNYRANQKMNVTTHREAVHLKIRQYPCEWPGCEYVGTTKDAFNKHRIVHIDERPFPCSWPDCKYWGKTKDRVKNHAMKVHSEARPFKCPLVECRAAFKHGSHLKRHQRQVHGKK